MQDDCQKTLNSTQIILWQNGNTKEYSFSYQISDITTITLPVFKQKISEYIQSNPNLSTLFPNKNIEHLYSLKENELEQTDLPYLKKNDIIFFDFENFPFQESNHFNQYEFIKWIKSGGYGQVFVAKHVVSKKEYAIKQINITDFSSEEIYNLSRENMILRSMNHKNIIKCYHSFAYNNKYYTVMEFARGGELYLLLNEKGKLSENDTKKIFKQIYNAVLYIHSKNIIHRDLKLNNILFLDEEKTKIAIIDFGISGISNGNQKEKIKSGTTLYLPPEVLSGDYSSNRKIDIWSMGVILFRMVEGTYPFFGKTIKEVTRSILNDKLIFNPNINISFALIKLIKGMLDKNFRFRIDDDSELFDEWFNNIDSPKCGFRNNNKKRIDKFNNITRLFSNLFENKNEKNLSTLNNNIGTRLSLPKSIHSNKKKLVLAVPDVNNKIGKKSVKHLILPLLSNNNSNNGSKECNEILKYKNSQKNGAATKKVYFSSKNVKTSSDEAKNNSNKHSKKNSSLSNNIKNVMK